MGNTMQRRQFLNRLSTRSSKPLHPGATDPQTVEKSFIDKISPAHNLRAAGIQSGISQYAGAVDGKRNDSSFKKGNIWCNKGWRRPD